jgi:hypothetical protein
MKTRSAIPMLRRCAKHQLPADRPQYLAWALRALDAHRMLRPNLLVRTYSAGSEGGVDQPVLLVKEG